MATASLMFDPIANCAMPPPPGFQDLYQRYSQTVLRAAYRVTGNAADAEDVLQTVFVRLLGNKGSIDDSVNPEPYLRRAATNAAIDLLRQRSSKAERTIDETRAYSTKENTLLLKERVRRAIATLPERDAELFVLCYLEGFSYSELIEQFGMEPGTLSSRLHRIRAALKKEIER